MKENSYGDAYGPPRRVAYLITGYINKTLTEAEHDDLDNWVNESDANMKLFEDLSDEKNIEANLKWMDEINTNAAYKRLTEEGKFRLSSKKNNSIFWFAAASVLVLVVGYLLYNTVTKKGSNTHLARNGDTLQKPANGVLLTLEDGTTIDISKIQNGLIDAGNATKENDSVLSYSNAGSIQNHLLKTPPGKTFQLKLPDGSNVWLNASSSLKFPTLFTGNDRIVKLEGEGYFEVAKNAQRPFKVIMDDSSLITVLGTHFNVNAYKNESKEVTLLEGAVNVSKAQNSIRLSPGTKVKISGSGIGKVNKADVESIMGWKNGKFIFKDADIKEIMSQLEHWYDIKAVYKGDIRHQFNAIFSRSESLQQILKLLELNGNVHFKTENNIVYVQP